MLKSLIYLIFSLAILFYALPRINFFINNPAAKVFNIVWLIFALLIIGAHLDHLLGLDEEKKKHLAFLKKYHLRERDQKILEIQRLRQKS